MNKDLRKAAEMALKFCEDIGNLGGPYPYVNETAIVSDSRKVLQALRQALAQPVDAVNISQERVDETAKNEHEPVCFLRETNWSYEIAPWDDPNGIPVYTAPPKREWVGLTGLEQKELMAMNSRYAVFETEAKLKEKNT